MQLADRLINYVLFEKGSLKGKLSWILSRARPIRSADIDRRLSKIRCDVSAYYCLTCSKENLLFLQIMEQKKGRLGWFIMITFRVKLTVSALSCHFRRYTSFLAVQSLPNRHFGPAKASGLRIIACHTCWIAAFEGSLQKNISLYIDSGIFTGRFISSAVIPISKYWRH